MRIIFLENQYQTYFWSAIAERMIRDGHQVDWIVQNPGFRPTAGTAHILSFPSSGKIAPASDVVFEKLRSQDRNRQHFGGNDAHYQHYFREIRSLLDSLDPAVAFGETTLFHELITAAECEVRGIPYFHPSSNRYPNSRFSFYLYATLVPFAGSAEQLSDEEADEIIAAIVDRKTVPIYMQPKPSTGTIRNAWCKIADKWSRTVWYWKGERFNTPSPKRKLALERELIENLESWGRLVKDRGLPERGRFRILFPLQMKPESNLDVWGWPHSNQAALLRDLVAATDATTEILIKLNPHAKYEMSKELLEVARSNQRVIPVASGVSMKALFREADMIFTVTGTVAIEATLSHKPVVTMAHTPLNRFPGCVAMQDVREIRVWVDKVRSGIFPANQKEEDRALMRWLVATSYSGSPSNPRGLNHALEEDHVDKVYAGFVDLLKKLEGYAPSDRTQEIAGMCSQ